MAKSKFLRYQDKNNDKVSDECPVLDIIPEPNVCLDCIPNPKAIVPKWTKKTIDDPFLNEKVCKFQFFIENIWVIPGYLNPLETSKFPALSFRKKCFAKQIT